jgi:PAS domain S-box-containing protein
MNNLPRQQLSEPQKTCDELQREIQVHRKTEQAIREDLKKIKHLISSLPTILIGVSKKNEIMFWNDQAEKIFDIPAARVMGLPLLQCGADCDWDKIAAGISRSRKKSRPVAVDEVGFRRPDGEERYLSVTVNPLNGDADNILGLTIIGTDITDRKKLEVQLQQSQKMEAIGQLAAGIAHEINTPTQFVGDNTRFFQDAFEDLISIISIYKELLDDAKSKLLTNERIQTAEKRIEKIDLEYLEEEVPLAIDHTLKGIDRIAKIVQAMKIFAHPGRVEKELVNINNEIEKTITITRNEWKYVAELVTDLDPSLSFVPCFRAEFNQVILNLIINAAHAIAEANKNNSLQKGTIRISTSQENNWAIIRIGDTGAGIPDEIQHKIFDLFFTTKEPGKGTGQGLAISHSVIVEKHGGTITMESQVGKGTTFIIGLPLGADSDHNE